MKKIIYGNNCVAGHVMDKLKIEKEIHPFRYCSINYIDYVKYLHCPNIRKLTKLYNDDSLTIDNKYIISKENITHTEFLLENGKKIKVDYAHREKDVISKYLVKKNYCKHYEYDDFLKIYFRMPMSEDYIPDYIFENNAVDIYITNKEEDIEKYKKYGIKCFHFNYTNIDDAPYKEIKEIVSQYITENNLICPQQQ